MCQHCDELLKPGIVSDEQQDADLVSNAADELHQGRAASEIDLLLEPHRKLQFPEGFGDTVQRLPNAGRRARQAQVEAQLPMLQLFPDPPRGLPAPLVQGPVEVVCVRLVPARFRVPKDGERLHFTSSASVSIGRPAASRCSMRAIATSSGTRFTCTPGGKAERRREGIAADRITNTPVSPWRRINLPNACARRARTTRSS